MRPLVFLIKAEESGENGRAYGHAERVRRDGPALFAENVQVAGWRFDREEARMTGVPLPDQGFRGLAYRVPAPPWFIPSGAANTGIPPPAFRPADSLRRFCLRPEVAMALAEDRLAQAAESWLSMPDLLQDEDALFRRWEEERPAAAAEARASGERAAAEEAGGATRPLRARLRRAALRRIDAAAVGREVFHPCPAYLGRPYLIQPIGGELSIKAGIVRSAEAWPRPETDELSRGWRNDPERVRAVERRLFPGLPAKPDPAAFALAAAEWLAAAPLRAFEAESPLPLFPCETLLPANRVPPGFRLRLGQAALQAGGATALTLAAARLSPYVAEPFHAYCQKRRGQLEEWARAPLALAERKWGAAEAG